MKTLKQLAQFIKNASLLSEGVGAVEVTHLSIDSRQVQAGDCFVAFQGLTSHGLDFLESVLKQEPALILSDRPLTDKQKVLLASYPPCSFWQVEDLESKLAVLADWFYDQPSQRVKVIGITGTNGKTSSAFYAAQLLDSLGEKVALIGTLGNGIFGCGHLASTSNTTPDVVSVHRLLSEYISAGAQRVVMEVSSHALELGRIQQVQFETIALTQVTRDHMDFHGTVEAYQSAKMKLFTDYDSKYKVLNLNDEVGCQLVKKLTESPFEEGGGVWGYQLAEQATVSTDYLLGLLAGEKCQLKAHGFSMTLNCQMLSSVQGQKAMVDVPLMGAFNVENLLCALSIVLVGMDESKRKDRWPHLIKQLQVLQSVEGRMQQVEMAKNCPTIIVDFAHTPDALGQVLSAVKQHLSGEQAGQLWVIFGCGGDRDQGKRPLMARIAEAIADHVLVTSDNPRFEEPQRIIEQIMQGFNRPTVVQVETDRKIAIQWGLTQASKQDIVVIAGKGHEDYQDIKGVKTPFKDEQIVLDWMEQNGFK
ncbi:MAG: UDP-N-acetylmuramoyl-L-alanyl-D-glutamate--2,6-diaminopimelate ligase [Thiomicrorhabdus sp.]|nr:MAG: UDP-N-acetylmuramoyl-L-alanyl-D-glutamate--2,6-diaminopimelate ligase [Thiomicrorhabdus sp.]